MRDLKSPWLMAIKAGLFLLLVVLTALGLWLRSPSTTTVLLALTLTWSAARLYYFLFYALHVYVDPQLRYSGLLSQLRWVASHPPHGVGLHTSAPPPASLAPATTRTGSSPTAIGPTAAPPTASS